MGLQKNRSIDIKSEHDSGLVGKSLKRHLIIFFKALGWSNLVCLGSRNKLAAIERKKFKEIKKSQKKLLLQRLLNIL